MAAPIYIPTNTVGGFPFQDFLFVGFFMVAILTSVRWHIVLICITLVISGDWHLFTCAYWPSVFFFFFLEKCLLGSSAHFLIGLFFVIELYELFVCFEN